VRCIKDVLTIGGKADVLDFEVAGSEQYCFASRCPNGIEVRPAISLPGKYKVVVRCPKQLRSMDFVEDAASAFCGLPHRLAFASGRIGYSNGPRTGGSVVRRQ